MTKYRYLFGWLQYLWPLPNTLLGLALGMLPFLGRREFVVRRGTLGIVGPAMGKLLSRAPITGGAMAITLGHVILALDREALDSSFEHEWIHVRQNVWWGPLFLPAYGFDSLWQWVRGNHAYLDNRFERQARKWS